MLPTRTALLLTLGFLGLSQSPIPGEEVQSHGLIFERWVCETFFGGYQPESYTQKWDIPAEINRHHGQIPVNPKAVKFGTPIGLGDAARQFEIAEPFLLILAFWQQATPAQKTWVNAQAVRIEPSAWKALWAPITQADLDRLIAVIKDTSLTLDEARAAAKAIKAAPPFSEAIMQVNPKIDASQRRLQCSLRYSDFFAHLAPQADPSLQEKPTLFGTPLPRSIESAPRNLGQSN